MKVIIIQFSINIHQNRYIQISDKAAKPILITIIDKKTGLFVIWLSNNQYLYLSMFSFGGNPIILEGSGRIKTDPINQQRIELVLSRFEEWASKNGQLGKFKYAINKAESEKSLIAFPAAGFAFGAISSYAFVHPNSKYIGKFFTLFTTWLGYKLHENYLESYNLSRRFGNFWNYPSQIRKMIDNNDARYAHKWLKNDYLQISNSE